MTERRHRERFGVWFPMKLEAPEEPDGVAVSRNVSEKGVLMATAQRLEVGASVRVTFRISDDAPERTVGGRIVRCERNDEDPEGLFPHRVAVEFDDPVPQLEPLLRRLGSRPRHAR